jgi:serine/threonine protein kinase
LQSAEDELGGLNSDQWRDLKACASRLEKALQTGNTPVDLLRFLPPSEASHRRAVLIELIKTELESRYVRGKHCLVEEFLERFPELGGPERLPASLLYEEYRARWVYGDRPSLDEYHGRFPLQFEALRHLVLKNPLPPPKENATPKSAPIQGTIRMGESRRGPPSSKPSISAEGSSVALKPLSGYERLELLGRGEFGEVWKALAPGGVEVALKFILRTLDHDATRRELKALEKIKQLHHPFLLQTHSFGMLDGKLTIVMELADGSLSDRFKECKAHWLGNVPRADLVTYFAQAAEALDYLQSQHVSHRDIKPQNLLMLQGFAKVADFGMARGQDNPLEEASMLCGTPHYMAPEIWQQQISRHSDQYSLAATYVQMRLGHPLFQGGFLDIFQHHLSSEPRLDPLPWAEQEVLKRALAKDPNKRFPSCVAFAQALKEATSPSVTAQYVPNRRRMLTVSVALLALAPYGVDFISKSLEPKPPPPLPPTSWLPTGWAAVNPEEIVEDRNGRRYFSRLVRDVGGQTVVMVVVPRLIQDDPPTFYIMENKVWNDLYSLFFADPRSDELIRKYSSRPGCEELVSREDEPPWRRGALAPNFNPNPAKEPFFGVNGAKGRLPVFRVTVTEAHCFAEWLGGYLPRRKQWLKAVGHGEDSRPAPLAGDTNDASGLAIRLKEGPWPIDRGNRDDSKYGCRQMISNGLEWTRDIQEDSSTIPLESKLLNLGVYKLSQSYLRAEILTFKALEIPRSSDCRTSDFETTFRIVLEEG